jgi:hypothetical protein
MPLLTGLGNLFGPVFYKDVAPTALKIIPVRPHRQLVADFHFQPG